MRKAIFAFVSAMALALVGGASIAAAADSPIVFDAATQAQFDAAKKVIPGLTPELFDGAFFSELARGGDRCQGGWFGK